MTYPTKGPADYLDLGDWNARCSLCDCKAKASWLVRNWQGQYRCPQHNEPRQPQDFVRAVPDITTPPWTQHPGNVYVFDMILVEGTGTLFVAEDPIITETGNQPLLTEGD